MYLSILLFAFVIMSLLMSVTYFILFSKNQEKFIQLWGMAWFSYSLSLIFLILSLDFDLYKLSEIRKIFDMYHILFLLSGAYAFIHFQMPSYWYRFSFYLFIWVIIGIYYQFDPFSVYAPIALFQIVATMVLCRVIYIYWQIPSLNKALVISVFAFWGIGKSVMSIVELFYNQISALYLLEIVFTNVLSFCIFMVYIQRIQMNSASGEKLYRTIAENATDVIFFYSLSLKPAFTYITPSVEALTGYSPREFYSNPEFYLNIADASYFEEITEIFHGKGGSTNTKIIKILTKEGVPKWCQFSNKIIFEEERPKAIESFVRDISLMKEAEEQLLQSKNSRDLLLSYISHELKTPVSSILGYVNGLLDGIIIDEKDKKAALQIISSKTITLERLIDDLFLLSKLETKHFSFKFAEISAEELCRELLQSVTMDINSADMELIYEADWDKLGNDYVIADPERIKQVLTNIVFNAIKFSKKGDVIHIAFEVLKEKNVLRITVSDQGTGISKENLPYIFDRFFKHGGDSVTEEMGNGLGLTLSKQILEFHGGQISAESTLGQGSVFQFELPIFDA